MIDSGSKIQAEDIVLWRNQIMKAADSIAALRGNVDDEIITTLRNTMYDMAFLVAYTESTLCIEYEDSVNKEAINLQERIKERLAVEDDRVRRLEEERRYGSGSC